MEDHQEVNSGGWTTKTDPKAQSLSQEAVDVFAKRITDSAEQFCRPFDYLPTYACTARKEIKTSMSVVASSVLSYVTTCLSVLGMAAFLVLSRVYVDKHKDGEHSNSVDDEDDMKKSLIGVA